MSELTMWEDPNKLIEIKKIFAPTLSPLEFEAFIGIGKATKLNPFLRELWAVKYGNAPAQIFIGRDGYRVSAQRNPDYKIHQSVAVYENEEFQINNGVINHIGTHKDRGKLVGAYCYVKKKSTDEISYFYADIEEFDKKQSNWKTMPSVMIRKCAEANALRSAFQEQFAGTYSEDEIDRPSQSDKLKDILNIRIVDNETSSPKASNHNNKNKTVNQETGEIIDQVVETLLPEDSVISEVVSGQPISIDQLTKIRDMMLDKKFNSERKKKALEYYKVSDVEQLSDEQADMFIMQLERA